MKERSSEKALLETVLNEQFEYEINFFIHVDFE